MEEDDRRITGVDRGREVSLTLDGEEIVAFEGETVAAALVAAGRWTPGAQRLAGIYCAMGACYQCLLICEGRPVRSCLLQVRDGMRLHRWGTLAGAQAREPR